MLQSQIQNSRGYARQNGSEEQTLSTANEVSTFYNEARSELDYFLLGATLAICGYLAQTNTYGRLGVNKETFLLITLLVFAARQRCGGIQGYRSER